jgi:hypothetical protein
VKNLQTFEEFLNEAIKTKEIDPSRFPDPGVKNDRAFFIKGKLDGNLTDDVVNTKKVGIPAKSLKPSQNEVFLGKTLDLAIRKFVGGDLGSMVSKDNRIVDGHHRWAATVITDPNMKLICNVVDLSIGDLIPVLRQAGDVLGNVRGTSPGNGDINIFDATIKDVEECIYKGKCMNPSTYVKDDAIKWFETNKSIIERGLKIIQSQLPPDGAPKREDMPKIKSNQVDYVSNMLSAGKIDVRDPYVNENKQNLESAIEKIDGLPIGKLFDDAKKIDGIFKMSKHSWNEVMVAYEQHEEQHHIVVIDIKDVYITQPNIQANKVNKMLDNIDKLPRINVVQFSNGEKAIYDGHHRLMAHWALGERKIKVNLVKI